MIINFAALEQILFGSWKYRYKRRFKMLGQGRKVRKVSLEVAYLLPRGMVVNLHDYRVNPRLLPVKHNPRLSLPNLYEDWVNPKIRSPKRKGLNRYRSRYQRSLHWSTAVELQPIAPVAAESSKGEEGEQESEETGILRDNVYTFQRYSKAVLDSARVLSKSASPDDIAIAIQELEAARVRLGLDESTSSVRQMFAAVLARRGAEKYFGTYRPRGLLQWRNYLYRRRFYIAAVAALLVGIGLGVLGLSFAAAIMVMMAFAIFYKDGKARWYD